MCTEKIPATIAVSAMPHEHSIGYEGRIDYGAIGTVTNLAFRAQSQSAITTSSDPKNDGHASPQIEARGARMSTVQKFTSGDCAVEAAHSSPARESLPLGRRNLDAERAISLLVGKQSKHSRNYRQSNQSTDDECYNRMSTGPELLRSGALLRRSDAQPEREITHSRTPRYPRWTSECMARMTARALGILNHVGPEENPTARCYIGQAGRNCHPPLRLRFTAGASAWRSVIRLVTSSIPVGVRQPLINPAICRRLRASAQVCGVVLS